LYERQNSKYFFTAERNEDMPFLIFEPGINIIPLGAALLSLSSSDEYCNKVIRLFPPLYHIPHPGQTSNNLQLCDIDLYNLI